MLSYGFGTDPFSVRVSNLQTPAIILQEDRNRAPIGVRTSAELIERGIARLRRVMQQAQCSCRILEPRIEVILRQVQR